MEMNRLPANLNLEQLAECLAWMLEFYPNEVAGFVLDMRIDFSRGEFGALDNRRMGLLQAGLNAGYLLPENDPATLDDIEPAVIARHDAHEAAKALVKKRLAALRDERWSERMKPLRQAVLASA